MASEEPHLLYWWLHPSYLCLLTMTAENDSHPSHRISKAQGLKSLFLGIARIGGYQYLCIPKYKR